MIWSGYVFYPPKKETRGRVEGLDVPCPSIGGYVSVGTKNELAVHWQSRPESFRNQFLVSRDHSVACGLVSDYRCQNASQVEPQKQMRL